MADTVPFKCPCCGADDGLLIVAATEAPKSYQDLLGSHCKACNHVVTDDDIKGWAREIAVKTLKDAFKR